MRNQLLIMSLSLGICFSLISSFGFIDSNKAYFKSIKKHRKEINKRYRKPETSPFKADAKYFRRLDYFPIELAYKVRARIERMEKGGRVLAIPTSNPKIKKRYQKFAQLHFQLKGKSYTLTAYKSLQIPNLPEYKDLLFLPFRDLTSGESTYGGGRYIDLRLPPENAEEIAIDFNLAYNPLCAYAEGYSCPIPPAENTLDVAIASGERDFPGLKKEK